MIKIRLRWPWVWLRPFSLFKWIFGSSSSCGTFFVQDKIDNLIIPIYILRFDFHWTQFHPGIVPRIFVSHLIGWFVFLSLLIGRHVVLKWKIRNETNFAFSNLKNGSEKWSFTAINERPSETGYKPEVCYKRNSTRTKSPTPTSESGTAGTIIASFWPTSYTTTKSRSTKKPKNWIYPSYEVR